MAREPFDEEVDEAREDELVIMPVPVPVIEIRDVERARERGMLDDYGSGR